MIIDNLINNVGTIMSANTISANNCSSDLSKSK